MLIYFVWPFCSVTARKRFKHNDFEHSGNIASASCNFTAGMSPEVAWDVSGISSNILRSCYAVQHERHDLDGDDFSQVWRSAQRRRSADIYFWFTHIFKERWRLKSPDQTGPA